MIGRSYACTQRAGLPAEGAYTQRAGLAREGAYTQRAELPARVLGPPLRVDESGSKYSNIKSA